MNSVKHKKIAITIVIMVIVVTTGYFVWRSFENDKENNLQDLLIYSKFK